MSVGRAEEPPRPAPSARHIVEQMKWLGAGEAVGQAAWYAMVLVLAALLSPRAFGTVAAGMAIVRVANMIALAGTGGALIAAPRITRGDVRFSVERSVLGALAFTAVIAVAGGPLGHLFAGGGDENVLRVLGLSVTLAGLAIVPEALLKKSMDFRRVSIITAAAAVTTSIVAIVAAVAGAGVWSLVIRQLLFEGLLAVLLWRAARQLLPSIADPSTARPLRRPAGRTGFLVVAASGMIAMTMDNMVVGATLDATHLGYYALAFAVAFAPLTQISWRFGGVLFPAAAATADRRVVGRRTVNIVRVTSLVFFPLVPVAGVLAPVLVKAVLGTKWEPMVGPLRILLAVGAAHAISNVIGESLSGTGNVNRRARWDASWAILTLTSVAVFAHFWGINGAASAHLVGYLPLAVGYVFVGTRLIGTSPGELWRAMRDVLAAVLVQSIVTVGVATALGGADEAGPAVAAAVAGLASAYVVLRLAPSRPLGELMQTLRLLRSRRGAVAES